jgi:hypothetical protein
MGSPGPWRNIFSSDVTDFTDNWQVRWDDLKEGNNTIEVQVFDLATNKNSTIDTIYFLKDINPPRILAKSEEYGWFNSDPGSIIDVDFDNAGTGSKLDFAEYRVEGGAWQKICQITAPDYTLEWCVDWSALTEGENIIQVRIWDEAGLSSNQNIKIYKDTVLPEIKINKAEYGWYFSDPGPVIDVDFYCDSDYAKNSKKCSLLNFSEYKIGLDGDWIRIIDLVSINYTDPWQVKWTDLKEGINEIYFRTQDEAGNMFQSTSSIKFKKDTQPPSLHINERNYGWFSKDPGAVIDVDFSYLPTGSGFNPNDHSQLSKAQYMINEDGKWINIFVKECDTYTEPWNISWSLLDQGENTIYLRVFDTVGNVYFDPKVNLLVFKDIETPEIIFNGLNFGWYNSDPGDVIDVDFDAGLFYSGYNKNSPLEKAQYKIGAYGKWYDIFQTENPKTNPVFNYNNNWSISWAMTQEGWNYIFVRVYDFAGNVNESNNYVIFQRDTVAPESPKLISPLDASRTADTTPQHRWEAPHDPGSNITDKYRIQINNIGSFSDNLVDTETSAATFTHEEALPVGVYFWRVQGIDNAGNVGTWSEVWRFVIVEHTSSEANLPPVAEAGDDVVAGVGEMIWFNGIASNDPENDPINYLWYLDNDPEPDAEGILIFWIYTEADEFTVTLVVFDEHGGSDSDSILVTILDTSKD